VENIIKYFPNLSEKQLFQFQALLPLYTKWNYKINVISRKDMEDFYIHHVLHSLGISKLISFIPRTEILDFGTGGGFPGIPLAIMFPHVKFYLVDSIGKKIKVVKNISQEIGLENVHVENIRGEQFSKKVDFIVSRAVSRMDVFVPWVENKINSISKNKINNGIIYLKGGDLKDELTSFPESKVYSLNTHFEHSYFETKKLVYLSI
tara:strand:+ start:1155 stop:1772 length:618 start_codon:yes stop_codon:yes gene_type:complete